MNRGGYKISDTSKMHHAAWNKGIKGVQKYSEETRRKNSESHKGVKHWWGLSGKDSPHWKGGITKIDRLIRRMVDYSQWRSDIFQRDKWLCKTCGMNDCYVTAHHIKSLSLIVRENKIKDINDARKCKELWNTDNGVTLCEKCHSLTDNYKGRAKNKK